MSPRSRSLPGRIRWLVAGGIALLATQGESLAASSLRVGPPTGHAGDLEALWHRASTATTIQLDPTAAAGAKRAPSNPSAAAGDPFARRLASLRAAARPDAAASFRGATRVAIARLAAFRGASETERRDLGRLQGERGAAYLALLHQSPDVRIGWDGDVPIFVSGSGLGDAAATFLQTAAPLFGIGDAAAELRLVRRDTDGLGMTHLRYQQVYRGHDVCGCDAIVHLDRRGRVVGMNGRLAPTPQGLGEVRATLDPAAAAAIAGRGVTSRAAAGAVQPHARALDLQVRVDPEPTLCWRVRVEAGLDRMWDVFVDASTGNVVHTTSVVATDGPVAGSGVDLLGQTRNLGLYQVGSTYYNIDASKPMFDAGASNIPQTVRGGIMTFDAQHGDGQQLFFSVSNDPNNWTGKAGDVSAAANGSVVYEYYLQRHGRNSIDGNGGTMQLVVNFKNNFNNAFWNGQFMVFGNGDGTAFSNLAAALDATAHEMTHGVVEHTANLVYETQSGALNESFADVFGACAEWFARPATANWLIGEDVTTPAVPGDALRNMQDPGAANVAFGGQQPTRMSEYHNLANDDAHDHGGVHINSGIPNRAFYLVATNPALGATDAERIDKAERIYYRALSTSLTRTAQFIDCRLAVIHAAEDLFGGAGNTVAQACAQAFDTVEILDGTPTEPPPTLPPVQGTDYIGVTDGGTGRLVRATPNFSDIIGLSSVAISNKPTYTDNGADALFIDSGHRLRFVRTDGTGENFLSSSPVWRSIAVSPDGNTLAATSIALDDTIYVLDLSGGGNDRSFAIHTVNYGGQGDDPAQFADFLDFSNDGQYVLYDAFNRKQQGDGSFLEYWDINLMRAADGSVLRVFPPQATGVNIGNPTFSPLSDFIVAFDFMDASGQVSVLGANLETSTAGVITHNFQSPGRPSFSPDATHVVYQYVDNQGASIWVVSLRPDGVTGAGDDVSVAQGGFDPVWFAVGTRPAVEVAGLAVTRAGDAAILVWEASTDAAHDHFAVLRDAGTGWERRSEAIRVPAAHGAGTDRWEHRDDLSDLPAGVESVVYAVVAVDRDGAEHIAATIELRIDAEGTPRAVHLLPNLPNPFNPTTEIRFTVGRRQPVRLDVYDAAGRRVRALWEGVVDPGTHARVWNGRDDAGAAVASGVYVARLATQDGERSRKLTLAR